MRFVLLAASVVLGGIGCSDRPRGHEVTDAPSGAASDREEPGAGAGTGRATRIPMH